MATSIHSGFYKAVQAGLPVALYRMPNQQELNLVIGDASDSIKRGLPEARNGFCFAPFESKDLEGIIFIEGRIRCVFKDDVVELKSSKQDQLYPLWADAESSVVWHTSNADIGDECTKEQFLDFVHKAIAEIDKGKFRKVVLSRIKRIGLTEKFDPVHAFLELSTKYPSAFVSLVSIPDVGTWIGATPELLVSLDKQGIFRTVALAGTQRNTNLPEKQAVWSHKEIEEQALVSRYIIDCFKKIRLREYDDVGPKTVVAGNLLHLKTDFIVDTKTIDYPRLERTMLNLLHPTSAVCGIPKQEALECIQQCEHHNREFYSGFLGPVIEDEMYIYVNLRCGQLRENQAVLYAGAGITADSSPELEWNEIESKFQTIRVCIL